MSALAPIFAAGIAALWLVIGIAAGGAALCAAWHIGRLSLARKPGEKAASRKVQGNVEQSHIRSSRTSERGAV